MKLRPPRLAAALLATALFAPCFQTAAYGQPETWLRTSLPGFVVYSDLSEAETGRRLAGLLVAIDDFSRIWPTPNSDSISPALIVFCGQPKLYSAVNPRFVHYPMLLRGDRQAFFNTRFTPWDSPLLPKEGPNGEREFFFKYPPLLDYWGNHLMQRVYSAYFQGLVGEREPPWLAYGLGKLMQGMSCREGAIEFPALTTDPTLAVRRRTHGSEVSLQEAQEEKQFFALDLLLKSRRAPPQKSAHIYAAHNGRYTRGPDNRSFWNTLPFGPQLDEDYEFVSFSLFADGGAHRAGFIRFALQASNGPPDEAALQNCLGLSERELLLALWRWTAFGRDQTYPVPPRSGLPVPPAAKLVFRPATLQETAEMAQKWSAAHPVKLDQGSDSSAAGHSEILFIGPDKL